MTTTVKDRASSPVAAGPKRDWKAEIRKAVQSRPPVIVLAGPPHVGKSSLAGNIPKAIAVPFRDEDTFDLLKSHGAIPAHLSVMPAIQSWPELLDLCGWLASGESGAKVAVLDTLGCAERLCHEHVCQRDYKGDWGERGFMGYQRGYETSLADWREFLNALDRIRDNAGITVFLVAHTKVEEFKNPEGSNFDRYTVDLHKKTWGVTHRWADAVLFCDFEFAVIEGDGLGKAKGRGGQHRVIYTSWRASRDAKNRFGLPGEIPMGNSGKEAWINLAKAIKEAKKHGDAE